SARHGKRTDPGAPSIFLSSFSRSSTHWRESCGPTFVLLSNKKMQRRAAQARETPRRVPFQGPKKKNRNKGDFPSEPREPPRTSLIAARCGKAKHFILESRKQKHAQHSRHLRTEDKNAMPLLSVGRNWPLQLGNWVGWEGCACLFSRPLALLLFPEEGRRYQGGLHAGCGVGVLCLCVFLL
ncbi:hypothetical protein B0H67DRAFT_573759, partial [Lasiosphaeris hirsuta]